MKYADNITELVKLPIDFMGLIFYPRSPRYVNSLQLMPDFPPQIKKTGVFVDADMDFIRRNVNNYQLDYLQLHGSESPAYCAVAKQLFHLPIIKAISISQTSDFAKTNDYENCVDFFLFDTKTALYGGSGTKFDWSIINEYNEKKPFFLSGGIGADDVLAISAIKHPMFYAIDLNSKFETSPGLKDMDKLKLFIENINTTIKS